MTHNDFLNRIGNRLDALLASPAAAVRDAPDAGVVVALSGGPDSVALLLAVRNWGAGNGRPIAAAHLNHRLRGAEADADTDFCRNLCTRLDVPLHVHEADPRPVARARGQGLEEAGRHLRREFCAGLLDAQPRFRWVAAGHHRDDQVETVLMRLFRGTGPEGLRGIRPVSGVWLHPLLGEDRAAIAAFLQDSGQPWRIDATNLAGDNVRARLRRELLPLARGIFGPGAAANPARLAELLEDDLTMLAELTADWLAGCRGPDGGLSVAALGALPPERRRRVLRAWLATGPGLEPERVHVDTIGQWLATGTSGSTLDLPDGLRLRRDFDTVRSEPAENERPALRFAGDYRILVAGGSTSGGSTSPAAAVPAARDGSAEAGANPIAPPVARGLAEGAGDPADEATWTVTCPADNLRGNLRIRNWRRGDRYQPFGLQGTKKLSDLLREHRVTRDAREGVLVVADDEGILWVVGLARSERTRLLPQTTRTVTISVVRRTGSNHNKD